MTAQYVDLASGPDTLWEALSERTRLVWFETPSNPHLKVVDIAAMADVIRRRAAEGGRRPLLVVDNTFASPALQQPLSKGADIVFHSATKYLSGHSDTILGVAVTADAAIAERLRFLQNAMGAVPGPLDCFLVLRGLRTLHIRMERHGTNARAVAKFLRDRADVALVYDPAMGGMVSFVPSAGGRHGRTAAERAVAIAEGTRVFTLAESLGAVELLIEVPALMTHMSVVGSVLEVDPAPHPPVRGDRGHRRPDRRPRRGARRGLTRGRARARQPPAIAGSRTRVSPSPTGVSSDWRWRTSVSLRNALTKRLSSPSWVSSCDSSPGWAATSAVTTSRTVPPGTATCFAPPVAVRSVGGMRTVLTKRRPRASARMR